MLIPVCWGLALDAAVVRLLLLRLRPDAGRVLLVESLRLVRPPVTEDAEGGRVDDIEGGRAEVVVVLLDLLEGRALPVLDEVTCRA